MAASSDAAVDAALAHHRAGRLEDAAQGYAAVLEGDPGNVRALHNFGLLLLRRKELDRALPMLAQAFEKAPPEMPTWVGYAQALIAAERFEEAERVLASRGSGPQAEALQLRLRQAWGMALMGQGRDVEAEAQFEQACALAPQDSDAHADLGLVRLRQGRLEPALDSLERAVALSPDNVAAWVNLGSARRRLTRYDAAEEAYRRALALVPDHAPATRNLDNLLRERRLAEGSLAAEAPPAGLSPQQLIERGESLASVGRHAEAFQAFMAAAEEPEVRYDALVRAAFVQATLRAPEEALATLDAAVALAPERAIAYHRRAFLRLLFQDYAGGWEDYEHRLNSPESFAFSGAIQKALDHVDAWTTPERLAGQRILLVAEQGIGDQIMFASMIPDLMTLAGEVTCVCDSRLVGLFGRSFSGLKLVGVPGASVDLKGYDRVLAMGSLGRLFRNRLEDFPATPFLAPDPARVAAWNRRLAPAPGRLRVGLAWRGGTQRTAGLRRSITLDDLRPILALPNCQFVSIQYGEVAEEVADVNARLGTDIRVFPAAEIDDFDDQAALVQAMDVVVSVQQTLVHLCGGVGQDCLTLLPDKPEWRYTLSAETMPWYRSVRLFRQAYPGDWAPVVQRVAEVLRRRPADPSNGVT